MMKFLLLSFALCCCSLWRVVMSVVINMTNHFQLILFPWYMPFEATLQAKLGVAHHVDLLYKHWIISPSYPVPLIIHQQPALLCMRCIQILAGMTYIAFQRRTAGFSSEEQDLNDSPVWPHPYDCILTPLSWSDPDFDKLPSWDKESLSVVWILNAAPSDWPQSKFSTLKLSISLLLHIPITKLVTIDCSTHSGTFGRWR